MPMRHGSPDPRRSVERILDTAHGVLVTLRRYGLHQALSELAQTAKHHGVSAVSLADALLAIAQNQSTDDCDPHAVRVARQSWGLLLDRNTPGPAPPLVNRLGQGHEPTRSAAGAGSDRRPEAFPPNHEALPQTVDDEDLRRYSEDDDHR
jgi:hypothetical protein